MPVKHVDSLNLVYSREGKQVNDTQTEHMKIHIGQFSVEHSNAKLWMKDKTVKWVKSSAGNTAQLLITALT